MKEQFLEKIYAIEGLEEYEMDMKLQELSVRTINKYIADIRRWLNKSGEKVRKEDVIEYKNYLYKKYAVASANSKVIAVNRYLKWLGFSELAVKTKRIQVQNGLKNMITKECYLKMLCYANTHKKKKMYYIMKTIAQTGIRIGELKFVTVEAVKEGSAVVWNKGKFRMIYFTDNLCNELLQYCEETNCISGIIFYGREGGKAITPGAVWKGLKYIARKIEVPEVMVYPHSFRHLFAKEYMRKVGDISELADLLGHSRLETTWIYTKTTSDEKRRKLELLDL
jgi:integrase/recombinase XerD